MQRPSRLVTLRSLLLVLATLAWSTLAAQTATSSVPLKLIVPFTPGTGIDLIARTLGPKLAERLGRAVVVENRPGASGNIGTEAVVRAPADGSTLLVTVNTLVMNRSLFPKLSFDPLQDLEPVALTSWGQLLLVASPQSGIKTAAELFSAARAFPGRLNYGSPGNGTPHHLAMELLKSRARVFITHIPYRGTGPAVTDLLGGQIDLMFLPIHVAVQHVKAGKLAALAISSPIPHPLVPDVPPLRQLGIGDVELDMWYGVLAPHGTSAELIARLNAALKDILASPEVRTAFETQGMSPAYGTPERFRQLMQADAQRWADVVREQAIKPD